MTATATHIPVLLAEAVEALAPHAEGIYVDGTFGRGGYTRALLNEPGTRVVAIDRDPEAIEAGRKMVAEFAPRLSLLHGPFGAMDVLLAGQQIRQVDGIALDLGVSSPQFDDAGRGFSFSHDGPLDMRMSRSGPSAADIVNDMGEQELATIIYTLGEERLSRRVARGIVEARKVERITRTAQLAEIIRKLVPRSGDGIDPATRSFQALRIHVNDEMGELKRALKLAEQLLKPRGRLAVVSFHSLEDRVVKDFMRRHSGAGVAVSRHLPANDHRPAEPSFHILTKKPRTASAAELALNPRARSAKLRVAERTDAPAMREFAA
jgi:16S rRNA (cytosine1402-N4)-methyltransferase